MLQVELGPSNDLKWYRETQSDAAGDVIVDDEMGVIYDNVRLECEEMIEGGKESVSKGLVG